jgi:O-antigen ligase
MGPAVRNIYLKKHSLTLLLVLAFCLQGAKTPIAFFICGSFALVLCAFSIYKSSQSLNLPPYYKEGLLFFFIGLSYFYSKNSSTSLFPTAQMLIFLVLWLWMKSNPEIIFEDSWLDPALVLLAILSALKTLFQIKQGLWGWGHSYGFFPLNPSINATWMASLGCFFLARRRSAWDLSLGILLAFMVIIGPSRGTCMALGAGLLYIFFPYISMRKAILGVALLALLFCLIPKEIIYRRLRLDEGNYRTKIWRIALAAASERPVVGYGPGNFEMAYQRYAFPVETDSVRFSRTTVFAHNEYLQVASDLGIPAFILLIIGILSALLSSTKIDATRKRPAKAAFCVMAVAACCMPVWHIPILVFITLIWGATLYQPAAFTPLSLPSSLRKKQGYAIATILLFSCITAALGWSALRDHWKNNQQGDRIVRWNPHDSLALKNWADQMRNPCQDGLPLYQQAVKETPDQVEWREAYGHILEACRQNDYLRNALEQYHAAYRLAPHRAINALAMGRIFYIHGNVGEALSWFENVRHIEPHYWECDLWIARCLFRLGKTKDAIWTLNYLPFRRNKYLAQRQTMLADLPSTDDPSGYSSIILAYDDHVIARELKEMRKHQVELNTP